MDIACSVRRPAGTCLCGRRKYETMVYRETAGPGPGEPPAVQEFAGIWRAACAAA